MEEIINQIFFNEYSVAIFYFILAVIGIIFLLKSTSAPPKGNRQQSMSRPQRSSQQIEDDFGGLGPEIDMGFDIGDNTGGGDEGGGDSESKKEQERMEALANLKTKQMDAKYEVKR